MFLDYLERDRPHLDFHLEVQVKQHQHLQLQVQGNQVRILVLMHQQIKLNNHLRHHLWNFL
jgi:hypothetical protein